MFVIKLSPAEVSDLIAMLQYAQKGFREVRVAADPIDQAFKVKVGGDVWSPPMGTVEK
jgi:hypothetical protein